MSDREKKIAEIREALGRVELGSCRITAFADLEYWVRFLLSDLDREREESRKLWEERDFWKGQYDRQVEGSVFLGEMVERLREERDKLIEVLRWYADAVNYEYRTSYLDQDAPIIDDSGQRARDILHEIGVTVE